MLPRAAWLLHGYKADGEQQSLKPACTHTHTHTQTINSFISLILAEGGLQQGMRGA